MKFEDINLIINDKRIMKNKLNIIDPDELKKKEREISATGILKALKMSGDFSFEHLCKIHKTIFGRLYDWAGKPREWNIEKGQAILNGQTVDYYPYFFMRTAFGDLKKMMDKTDLINMSTNQKVDSIAFLWSSIWQIHPFPEGNTRTTATFMEAFLTSKNINLDFNYLNSKPDEFRNSLCLYTKEKQKPLISFIRNAILPENERTNVVVEPLKSTSEMEL